MEEQVVSKERITNHGEVYTRKPEVNAMLDLVRQETERIESRFLEPACGTGNFLVEVLVRKLRIVESRYKKSQLEFERYAMLAVSSIYGIDILEGNVKTCRNRLFYIFDQHYSSLFQKKVKNECRKAVRYVFMRNILHGDALTLKTIGDYPQPIIFSEWSLVRGSMIKRRDFAFHELIDGKDKGKMPLFSAVGSRQQSDVGDDVFIPEPVKEYPLTHFLEVANVEQR